MPRQSNFIKAGGDVAIINGTRESVIQAYEGLVDFFSDGRLSEKRIDESLYRILDLKKSLKDYLGSNICVGNSQFIQGLGKARREYCEKGNRNRYRRYENIRRHY